MEITVIPILTQVVGIFKIQRFLFDFCPIPIRVLWVSRSHWKSDSYGRCSTQNHCYKTTNTRAQEERVPSPATEAGEAGLHGGPKNGTVFVRLNVIKY